MSLDPTKDPNHSFMMSISKTGKPLRILLSKKPTGTSSASKTEESGKPKDVPRMILPDPPHDELLINRKKLINFYDMGQVWNPGLSRWEDTILDVGPQMQWSVVPGDENGHLSWTIPDFSLTDWATVHTELFVPPQETWKTVYRKVEHTDSDRYGLAYKLPANVGYKWLDDTNDDWSDKGLKPSAKIAVRSARLSLDFDMNDTTNYKITASYNFAASEVAPSLASGGDVFLIPQLCYYAFDSYWDASAGTPVIVDTDDNYYFAKWGQHSRVAFLNRTGQGFPFYFDAGVDNVSIERPLFGNYNIASHYNRYHSLDPANTQTGNESFLSDSFQDDLSELYSKFTSTYQLQRHHTNAGASDWIEINPANPWRDGRASEYTTDLWTTSDWAGAGSPKIILGIGLLRGIIKPKSGGTFYIWSKTNNVAFDYKPWARFAWYDPTFL